MCHSNATVQMNSTGAPSFLSIWHLYVDVGKPIYDIPIAIEFNNIPEPTIGLYNHLQYIIIIHNPFFRFDYTLKYNYVVFYLNKYKLLCLLTHCKHD